MLSLQRAAALSASFPALKGGIVDLSLLLKVFSEAFYLLSFLRFKLSQFILHDT
jgi:hypothetical protein